MKWPIFLPLFLCFALSACAAMPPHDLLTEMTEPVTVAEARERPDAVTGKQVLWGGKIARTVNTETGTRIEVVQFPLDRKARPLDVDQSDGRFIAQIDGFLDAMIYGEGRELTVVGRIRGVETQPLGETEYRYPVLTVEKYHLWEKREPEIRVYPTYPPFYYRHRFGWWHDDPYWR
jgi:outer membrane lipoprotein